MKITVIIPMYNAEKYLAVCLESILIQTFKDFEVIVVDDASTDNSVAIAESYLEKFGGRLKILSLEKNTGGGGIPRNIGLEYARGKYVFFMDADDLLIDDALETLYNFAEEYQTDVVYMEKGFHCGEEIVPQNLTEVCWNPPQFVSFAPTFEVENISQRIDKIFKRAIAVTTWTKFIRRDFLIGNSIKFPNVNPAEDIVWSIKLICLAEKILRIPNPLYVYRLNNGSVTRKSRSFKQELIFWINPLLIGLDCLDEFMRDLDFFKENSAYRFKVLNFFAQIQLDFMLTAFQKLEHHEAYKIFLEAISKSKGNHNALIAYLLVMNNIYRSELSK